MRSYSALLGTWTGSSGLRRCWQCRDTVQRRCTGRTLALERKHERHCAPPHSRLQSTETHRRALGQIHCTYFQNNQQTCICAYSCNYSISQSASFTQPVPNRTADFSSWNLMWASAVVAHWP